MDLLEICESEYLSLENVMYYFELYPYTDPNMTDYQMKTALHHVCYNVNATIDIVKYLVSKGANIHAQDGIGNLPIHAACCNINEDMSIKLVKYFIKNGVSVKQKNSLELNCLHAACLSEVLSPKLLRYLVDKHIQS